MLDINNPPNPDDEPLSIKSEFVNLCDEFSAFNNYCAFFCESVSLHALSGKPMDKVSAHGLERFAQALRDKSQQFDNWLQELHVKM
ncbi:hypothetical protein [Cellvibrio sp. PSBB006]|uniref:hypothetical protein n=1 Tax=Cellvibrio sp. PSBB006 TaxID=1987723 RepID=UPI000B3B5B64|nr:hypothetical protein [Cellvibrio sp. PSBB006]ARU29444.1 hypothetical protein CBR65_19485 [Cellvibrio sp. PSBB006]